MDSSGKTDLSAPAAPAAASAKELEEQAIQEVWQDKCVLAGSVQYSLFDLVEHTKSLANLLLEAAGIFQANRIVLMRERLNVLDFMRSKLAWTAAHNVCFTHLFMFDTDMDIRLEHITALLKRGVDVVSGTYYMGCYKVKGDPPRPTEAFPCVASRAGAYISRSEIADAAEHDELITVDAVGCGCLLVTTDALRRIGTPAFRHNWHIGGNWHDAEFEDGFFSRMARSAGLKVQMDPRVRPDHYKLIRVNHDLRDINGVAINDLY